MGHDVWKETWWGLWQMMLSKRMPLWGKGNHSYESSLFSVGGGQAVVLTAVGFEKWATQGEGEFRVEQMACVERVLHEFAPSVWSERGCGWVLELDRQMAEEVASVSVAVGECEWTLTECRNIGVIGLPGVYRLRLNDEAAVGVVQVYAELYEVDDIRPASLFFG